MLMLLDYECRHLSNSNKLATLKASAEVCSLVSAILVNIVLCLEIHFFILFCHFSVKCLCYVVVILKMKLTVCFMCVNVLCEVVPWIVRLHHVVLCQALTLFHLLPRRFRSSLQLLCLHLIFQPSDRLFRDLTRPACPTCSRACRLIMVSLLRRLLDCTRL